MNVEVNPGYKLTEAGVIPEDWESVSLGDMIKLQRGYDLPNRLRCDGDIPIISSAGITSTHNRAQAEGPGVVTGRYGTIGEVFFVEQKYWPLNTTLYVKDFKGNSRRFIYYLLKTIDFKSHSGKSGVPGVNRNDLHELVIAKPPIFQQRAIASALSDMDALISGINQLIAKKRDIKQAAMQQLLTGKQRLPGFTGERVPTQLGNIADPNKKWSFTGGPFGSDLKSTDYTDSGVRIIQLQNIGDGTFHNDYAIFTSPEKADELLSCNVYPGEIILSKMGDPVARACIAPKTDERYLMCSDGIRLSVDQRRFNPLFIFFMINAPVFRNQADNAGTGSTRKRIGLTQLRKLEIDCPSIEEQTAIAIILSDMDTELAKLESSHQKALQLKQGMMQELLTGRIRLI